MKKSKFSALIRGLASLGVVITLLLPANRVYAAAILVTSNADVVAVNGQCTLREALANANNDAATNVDCAAGTGVDTITFSGAMTITLTASLPNITDTDLLTINGGSNVIVSGNNLFRIVTVNAAANVAFQNITLQDGVVNGNGGAIVNNGNLTVTNVLFNNNSTITTAGNDGGAISQAAGTLVITNSTFSNNFTQDNGGAINFNAGTATITGTTFLNNNNVANDDGGAIYMVAGTMTLTNSVFTNNSAGLTGGAIRVAGGTLTVNGSTFTGNSVTGGDGGAIYYSPATLLTITNSTFTANRVNFAFLDGDGGAIYLASATAGASLNISGSTFTGNLANDDGGALVFASEPVTITNTIFANNQTFGVNGTSEGGAISTSNAADATTIRLSTFTNNSVASVANVAVRGGAISNLGAAFILANDTFNGNSVTKTAAGAGNAQGGAIFTNDISTIHNVTFNGNSAVETGTGTADGGSLFRNAGVVTVANSILSNSLENAVAGNCGGTITNGGNNIHFNGADCGAAFTNINPNLAAITGSPAYYPLNPISPAIDAGSNAICATATSTNNQSQNGAVRPIDGNSDTVATCDIGSFELADASPIVSSITRVNPSPTNLASVQFTVTFSESVTGVAAGNFVLTTTGVVSGASVTGVAGAGTTWTVTVNTGSGDGTLRLDMANSTGVTDGSGNSVISLPFITGQVYTIDKTGPTVTINQAAAQPDPTNVSPINFTVTFGEAVVGFTFADVALSGTGTPTTAVVTGGPIIYNVAVTGMVSGTVIADVVVGAVTDAFGNLSSASTSADNIVGYDITAPSVVSIVRANANPTNSASVNYTVTFDESLTGGAISNFNIVTSGVAGASITSISGSGTTRTVTVNTGSGSGTIRLDMVNSTGVIDVGGNGIPSLPFAGEIYTVDKIGPTVTIDQALAQNDPTNVSPINFTVVFGEAVAGFTNTDVTLAGSAGATTVVVSGGPTTYNVAVSGMTVSGTVSATVIASAVNDALGNPSSASTSTDNLVTYDITQPSATSIVRADANPTNAASVDFTVTFSENVTGVDTADFTLTTTGVAGASIASVSGSGLSYTVTINTGAGSGTIRLNLINNGTIRDTSNNNLSGPRIGDETYTIDKTVPAVTINQAPAQADPTAVSPINFVATFSEPVTGFDAGDINLSGTAGAITVVITEIAPNDGTTYNVAVSGMSSDGTVIADVDPLSAQDTAGNDNTASTSADNIVTYDTAAPNTTITGNPTNPSTDNTPTFTFTGNDGAGSGINGFECRLNAGLWSACVSGVTLGPLADGAYTFEVRAIDIAGNIDPTPASYTWTIDVNEAAVVNPATFSVNENSINGTAVGTVTYSDVGDIGQTYVCSIQSGNTGGAFAINPSTCAITVNTSSVLNFEVNPTFSLVVRVTDNGLPVLFGEATITINLNNVNETPTDIALSNNTIIENNAVNAVIGVLSAADPDAGATFTFSLTCTTAGANDGSFNMAGTTLRATSVFDFEVQTVYNICIRVADQGGLTYDENFVVNVTNANESPVDIALSNNSIAENNAANAVIGVLSATDPDAGATFTFSLACSLAGANDGSFNIFGTNLRAASSFDFETQNVYNICIHVVDQSGLAYDENFIVIVSNVNEAPTDIALSNNSIAENNAVNAVIGTLSATDPDAGAIFTFSLTCTAAGPNDSSFNISGSNLRASSVFDFETQSVYNICVRVTDQGGLTYDENFVVNVTNVNETPTDIILSNNTVDENLPANTIVGLLTATDPDAGATFTFTFACTTAGTDDASFNIAGANLQTGASFDFETQNVYNICFRVTDQGGLTYDENFVVNVNNVNEAPSDIALSNNMIAENNGVNTVVGALSATDPDAGATFTFALACTSAGADDGSFNVSGTNLRASASYDFETKSTYNLCLRVTDQGGLTYDEDFVVNVSNANEAPADIALSNNNIVENNAANAVIGVLSATDPDAGAIFTFSLTCAVAGANDASFNVAGTNLRAASAFDFETQNTYNICLRVTDQGGLTYDENFVVNVNNVNEAPTDIALSNGIIAENNAVNAVVGILSATDPDAGATFTFSLSCTTAGADDNSFNVLGTNLQASNVFNFEAQNVYNICIRVTDQGGLNFDENFIIIVSNVNEGPTDITLSNNSITENNIVNAVVGVLSATDPDAGGTFTFSLTCTVAGANDGSFNIAGANLRATSIFDFETQTVYNICIRVADQGGLMYDESFVVNITNANDAPTNIALSNNSINENLPINTVVGTLGASDPDAGETFTFSLSCAVPGTDDASFNVSVASLQTSAVFDFETDNSYTICIRVTDSSSLVYEETFVVSVINANDAPAFTSSPILAANEGVAHTYNITTIDEDGDTLIITAPTLPGWLSLTDNGDGTASLSGIPGAGDVGPNSVVLQVDDPGAFAQQAFTITVGNTPPVVITNGVNTSTDTGDGILTEWEVVTVSVSQFIVKFDQDVLDPAGDTGTDDVTNPANYMLVRDNGDGYQTTTCALGVNAQDTAISIDSIAYNNNGGSGPFVSTINVNSALPLSNGNYRLYICGTTSITDLSDPTLQLAGDGTNEGTDFIRNFIISINSGSNGGGGNGNNNGPVVNTRIDSGLLIPVTGFAPYQTTLLPTQPAATIYTSEADLQLEIPSLSLNMPIVGVPLTKDGWDVKWLGGNAGYLEGSAYPTWMGNSVLTSHVTDANGKPGPFYYLNELDDGDKIIIHYLGQQYIYEVREEKLISPENIGAVFEHENYQWLTLVTCENYSKIQKKFLQRRIVRAILISVVPNK